MEVKDASYNHFYSTLYCIQNKANDVRQVNETNDVNTGKEEIKMSPFAGDVILFIENSEDFPGPKKQKSIRTNK